RITPPQPKHRLETIQALLDHEHGVALQEARSWTGRLVLERRATRILIVSDSPDQERAVDHRLAGEVRRLQATLIRTVPLEISADTAEGTTQQS
ncbi:MAG TPA: hypothetical protein VLB49_11940, partial [Gemmatimonadales bacterium]|nr:hypothetical protein [Gemmatimonadales bacterium]